MAQYHNSRISKITKRTPSPFPRMCCVFLTEIKLQGPSPGRFLNFPDQLGTLANSWQSGDPAVSHRRGTSTAAGPAIEPGRISEKSTGLLWLPAYRLCHIRNGRCNGTQRAHSSPHRARWLLHRAQARGALVGETIPINYEDTISKCKPYLLLYVSNEPFIEKVRNAT